MTTSTVTLATIRSRVAVGLGDEGRAVWDDDALDEAIRRAVSDLGRYYGEPPLLSGLDSASLTTLQKEDETALVTGAEFFAAFARIVDRLETPNFNEEASMRFLDWTATAGKRYAGLLGLIRLGRLQQSQNAPHAALEWNESAPQW